MINSLSTCRTSLAKIHFIIIKISRKYYLESDDNFYSKVAGAVRWHTLVKPRETTKWFSGFYLHLGWISNFRVKMIVWIKVIFSWYPYYSEVYLCQTYTARRYESIKTTKTIVWQLILFFQELSRVDYEILVAVSDMGRKTFLKAFYAW